MAWVYAKRYIRAGTVVDWRDVSANINTLAAEWNGLLDRDNVPPSIVTRARVAPGAFNASDQLTIMATQNIPTGSITGWFDVNELVGDIETRDGFLVVDAWVQFETTLSTTLVGDSATDFVEIRILLGGTVVAETGWCSCARKKTCLSLIGYAPTGSGTTRAQVQVRAYRYDLTYNNIDVNNGVGLALVASTGFESQPTISDINMTRGALVYRHGKR
jgi:hypothetical protein